MNGNGWVTSIQKHSLETAVGTWVHEDRLNVAIALFASSSSASGANGTVALMLVMDGSAAERFPNMVSGEFE